MPAEYTYFRAEGASLSAIETITEARQEMAALEKAVCERLDASGVIGAADPQTGRYFIEHIKFDAPKKPPADWVETIPSGRKYMMPPSGSPGQFYLADMAGLMERAVKRLGLEAVLKTGEMPMRDMEAGATVSTAFVRYSMAPRAGDKQAGTQSVPGSGGFSVLSGPWKAADPLAFMKLDGDYYIRVPNRLGTEIPVVTPFHGVAVSYEDVLAADKREQAEKFNRLRSTTFDGYCC